MQGHTNVNIHFQFKYSTTYSQPDVTQFINPYFHKALSESFKQMF